jgi:hypothetical protein
MWVLVYTTVYNGVDVSLAHLWCQVLVNMQVAIAVSQYLCYVSHLYA